MTAIIGRRFIALRFGSAPCLRAPVAQGEVLCTSRSFENRHANIATSVRMSSHRPRKIDRRDELSESPCYGCSAIPLNGPERRLP